MSSVPRESPNQKNEFPESYDPRSTRARLKTAFQYPQDVESRELPFIRKSAANAVKTQDHVEILTAKTESIESNTQSSLLAALNIIPSSIIDTGKVVHQSAQSLSTLGSFDEVESLVANSAKSLQSFGSLDNFESIVHNSTKSFNPFASSRDEVIKNSPIVKDALYKEWINEPSLQTTGILLNLLLAAIPDSTVNATTSSLLKTRVDEVINLLENPDCGIIAKAKSRNLVLEARNFFELDDALLRTLRYIALLGSKAKVDTTIHMIEQYDNPHRRIKKYETLIVQAANRLWAYFKIIDDSLQLRPIIQEAAKGQDPTGIFSPRPFMDTGAVLRRIAQEATEAVSITAYPLITQIAIREFWRKNFDGKFVVRLESLQNAVKSDLTALRTYVEEETNLLSLKFMVMSTEAWDKNKKNQVDLLDIAKIARHVPATETNLFAAIEAIVAWKGYTRIVPPPPLVPEGITWDSTLKIRIQDTVFCTPCGWVKVFGSHHAGKSTRLLSIVHSISSTESNLQKDILWVDVSMAISSMDFMTRITQQLFLRECFTKDEFEAKFHELLSSLRPGAVVIFDNFSPLEQDLAEPDKMDDYTTGFHDVFAICQKFEKKLCFVTVSVKGVKLVPDNVLATNLYVKSIVIGPLPDSKAKEMAAKLMPFAPNSLAAAGRRLPGEMHRLARYSDLKTIREMEERIAKAVSVSAAFVESPVFYSELQYTVAQGLASELSADEILCAACLRIGREKTHFDEHLGWALCKPIFTGAVVDRAATVYILEGSKVEANYRGQGKWYKGKVTRDRGDGFYDVTYDVGESETRVPKDMIRLLKPAAKDSGDSWGLAALDPAYWGLPTWRAKSESSGASARGPAELGQSSKGPGHAQDGPADRRPLRYAVAFYEGTPYGGPVHGGPAHGSPAHGGPTHGESPYAHDGPVHGGPADRDHAHGGPVFGAGISVGPAHSATASRNPFSAEDGLIRWYAAWKGLMDRGWLQFIPELGYLVPDDIASDAALLERISELDSDLFPLFEHITLQAQWDLYIDFLAEQIVRMNCESAKRLSALTYFDRFHPHFKYLFFNLNEDSAALTPLAHSAIRRVAEKLAGNMSRFLQKRFSPESAVSVTHTIVHRLSASDNDVFYLRAVCDLALQVKRTGNADEGLALLAKAEKAYILAKAEKGVKIEDYPLASAVRGYLLHWKKDRSGAKEAYLLALKAWRQNETITEPNIPEYAETKACLKELEAGILCDPGIGVAGDFRSRVVKKKNKGEQRGCCIM